MKYADDSYLLIGSRNIQSVHDELGHITAWAAQKNLHLNPAKTREMVVIRKTRPSLSAAPPIAGGTRSSAMNILGITIDERLSVSDHVDTTLSSCSSSLYALRTLRARGMPQKTLYQVKAATTIGRLMYGSPAWWGYSSERDLNRLESFIRRAKRGGFLPDEAPSFREMAALADSSLFKTLISNPNHVLRSLCTLRPTIRPRPHPFNLPLSDNRNFLSRLIFLGTY